MKRSRALLAGGALLFVIGTTPGPLSAQESAHPSHYRLGLATGESSDALRAGRRVQIEFPLESGVERVSARVVRIESTRSGAELLLELTDPRAVSDPSAACGLLWREDHARVGASLGWTVGSLLGLFVVDAAQGGGSRSVSERMAQLSAGLLGGFLGGRGGGLLGRAWGRTRGCVVQWMRPTTDEARDQSAPGSDPGIALPARSVAP